MRITFVFFLSLLVGPALLTAADLIPLPAAELTHLYPLGGQVGTTVEVIVIGQHLDRASALVFANPSIIGEPKLDAAGKPVPNVFLVKIPPTIKPGEYDVRVRGKFGLSNPRRFCIGSLPETSVPTPGASVDKSVAVALNTVVDSSCVANARGYFKFHLPAKQRIFIRVDCPDSRFDPQIEVSDASHHNVLRGKSELALTASADGEHILEIHDLYFHGGGDCRFRLTLSTEPPPEQRTDSMASAYLDDAEISRINALAPKAVADTPRDLALTPPCEFIAMFPIGGQPSSFTFKAKKGSVYWIEVFSHRLGHATDPELILSRADGPAGSDENAAFIAEAPDINPSVSAAGFALNMRDGSIRFEAKDDSTYRLTLRDLFNTAQTSPRLPYRLCIREATPDFQLVAVPDQGPRAKPPANVHLMPSAVRRGGVASFRVFVQRQDGFAGDIVLKAENLPPGVTCLGAVLGNGDECASLTFYADDNAAPWAGLVRVIGTAKINGQDASRVARTGSPIWTVNDMRQETFRARLTDGVGLGVIAEEAPLLIEPETSGVIEAIVNSKISLKLKISRRGGYDELIKVRSFVLGEQDKSAAKEMDIPAKAISATLELDLAQFAAKVGEHTFVLHGNADRVKYKKNADEIPAAEAEKKKRIDEATAAAAALKKAQDALAASKQKATEAEAKSKAAPPAEKAALEAAAKSANDAVANADKALKDADAKSKDATQAKAAAEKFAAELAAAAQPKDMTFVVFSKPIRIRIVEAPAKK